MLFDSSAGILGNVFKRREIIDLDNYKSSADFADEYFKFVSIDARLLSPLSYDQKIFGAVALGEKITIGDYTDAEKDFILSISEISAVALGRINAIESNRNEAERYRSEIALLARIDALQSEMLARADMKSTADAARTAMAEAGVESFAVFLKDEKDKAYMPVIVDSTDSLGLSASSFGFHLITLCRQGARGEKGVADRGCFSFRFDPVGLCRGAAAPYECVVSGSVQCRFDLKGFTAVFV